MERVNFQKVCEQFGQVLRGKSQMKNGVCSVSFKRQIDLTIQGKKSSATLGVNATFESLDQQGLALNISEVPILESEIPTFEYAVVQQGLIISAIHNHWLYTNPTLLYIHLQSVEPPIQFAQKLAYAFTQLREYPKADH